MVTVKKPDSNKLSICLYPKDLNVAIKWEHFDLPTVEEITARMAGAKVFSKIELNLAIGNKSLMKKVSY